MHRQRLRPVPILNHGQNRAAVVNGIGFPVILNVWRLRKRGRGETTEGAEGEQAPNAASALDELAPRQLHAGGLDHVEE